MWTDLALIAEADDDLASVVATVLQDMGLMTIRGTNLEQCYERLTATFAPPALLLANTHFPEGQTLRLLESLTEWGQVVVPPLILWSPDETCGMLEHSAFLARHASIVLPAPPDIEAIAAFAYYFSHQPHAMPPRWHHLARTALLCPVLTQAAVIRQHRFSRQRRR